MNEVPPSITITPVPLVQGEGGTIKVTGKLPADVTLTFKPDTIPDMHLHVGLSGEVEFTVPSNGVSVTATDDAGIADADSTMIEPS